MAEKWGKPPENSPVFTFGVGGNGCCTNATKNALKICHIDKLIFLPFNVIIHISKIINYPRVFASVRRKL